MSLCKRTCFHAIMLKLHIFTEATILLLVLTFSNNIFRYFSWWNCWLDKTSCEVINLVNAGLALHSIFHPVMSKHLQILSNLTTLLWGRYTKVLLSPFCSWGNWSPEGSCDLPKIRELMEELWSEAGSPSVYPLLPPVGSVI